MAFADTLFPNANLKLIHGFRKGVVLPTTIVGNSSVEYRIRKVSNYRSTWQWPARSMLATDREAVVQFFTETASFSLISFKFKCPVLNQWSLTPLLYTGASNQFYLTARGSADTHPIFHLGNDVVVRVGTTALTSGQWSKSVVNGVPVITVPGHTSNVNISGTFYHAARFDQSSLDWTMEALASDNSSFVDSLGDISLIEVFEY